MIVALKLTLVPLLIALISLVGQRFGNVAAGLLAGLPVVAGSIFLFMTAEQGIPFGVQVAVNTLVGLVPFATFTVCYGWLCSHFSWPTCLGLSWLAYVLCALALSLFEFPLFVAGLIGLSVPLVVPRLFPVLTGSVNRRALPPSEIPLRMLAGGVLVYAITEAAKFTRPEVAGLFTPFPILASVLTVFSHRLNGPAATVAVLRGLILGLFGFVVFFVVEASLLEQQGVLVATLVAILATLVTQGLVFWGTHMVSRSVRPSRKG